MLRKLLFLLFCSATLPAGAQSTLSTATFALGCFWCGEEAFEKVPGVVSAVSGYLDGKTKSPTYEQVSSGMTGHTEGVEVKFDPSKVSYEQLLDVFWLNHDPTTLNRQFCDAGSQYRPGIYWHDEAQRKAAEASKAKYDKLKTFKQPIITPIVKTSQFYACLLYTSPSPRDS